MSLKCLPSPFQQKCLGIFYPGKYQHEESSNFEPRWANLVANAAEEVRALFVHDMNKLHTDSVITIPVPGRPSGMAGLPPVVYETPATKLLRIGGIPMWKRSCGLPSFSAAEGEGEERRELEQHEDEPFSIISTFLPDANIDVLRQ